MPLRILFYNANNGSGSIGRIGPDSFNVITDHAPDFFPRNWSMWGLGGGGTRCLLYDGVGAAQKWRSEVQPFPATGVSGDVFVHEKSYPPGTFGRWTHIMGRLPLPPTLLYNSNDGSGSAGYDPVKKAYPPGSFSTGWTHLLQTRHTVHEFFYNSNTGSAAFGFDPPRRLFPAGSFRTGWTHIAVGPSADFAKDEILFYNRNQRSGAIATVGFDANNFTTTIEWGQNSFDAWTHVVGTQHCWLFYDAFSGKALVATRKNGELASTFANISPGWTHIVRVGRDDSN
ncbi:hypothetical protein ACFXGT_38210 [Streptomyces sp. NPDC059352]|uniref:hypothetical protein n=1 Tax=Streptomyces sp. NPDC059352 TaxID=3346810 RepID=UPI003685A719